MAEHRRPHWSNWSITINTNRHERTEAAREASARALADAVDDACTQPQYLWRWLKHFVGGEQIPFTAANSHWVQRIRARVALEVGPNARNRSVHCHILLEVQHVTRLQIDHFELKRIIEEITGWRGTNIQSRFVKGDGEDKEYLLRYLQKDGVPRRPAREEDNHGVQMSETVLEIEDYP